jgi:hypothetical protein
MSAAAAAILAGISAVREERGMRLRDAALGQAVTEVKRFQHARFAWTYRDLMAQARFAGAARFFLEDLYGPTDFTERDEQFARIVPALVRLFPAEIVHTVSELAGLHALSERLDSAMGRAWLAAGGSSVLEGVAYGQLWREVGEPPSREQQIRLMVAVGAALDRYTRNAWLRHTLRLMRGPAQAAGLGALQGFLERGFDTFKAMGGAAEFLGTIEERERDLAERLFSGSPAPTP